MTYKICPSDDVKAWLHWAFDSKGTDANRAYLKFRDRLNRLEDYGPDVAELPELKKIRGVAGLWQLRVDAYRMFMGFGPEQRIVISSIVEKRRGNFPQETYRRESRRVAELMESAAAGRLRC